TPAGLANERESPLVGLPAAPAIERLTKRIVWIVPGQREQRHAGAELEIVGGPEDRMKGWTFAPQHDPGAEIEPWPQHRVGQIGAHLVEATERRPVSDE